MVMQPLSINRQRLRRFNLGLAFSLFSLTALPIAARPADVPLIDFLKDDVSARIAASTADEVTFAPSLVGTGLEIVCPPGRGAYPGIQVKPEGPTWDLSSEGYVEARVTKIGIAQITITVRVDEDGDWTKNPWNAENIILKPRETQSIRVRFGYSWGKRGFALHSKRVARVLIFTTRSNVEQSFRVESLSAGGRPGEMPPLNLDEMRVRPENGILVGKGVIIDPLTQLTLNNGGDATVFITPYSQCVRANLPASDDAWVKIRPSAGRWDLRDWLQIVVRVRNMGKRPLTLRARIESSAGTGEWTAASNAAPPGVSQEVRLPFAGPPVTLTSRGATGGSIIESDRISGIFVSALGGRENSILIESIQATTPPPAPMPAWLGKRPPAPGAWKQTLSEEFNGKSLNSAVWTIYHPNYWDKSAHFSKSNVILGGGVVKLRFEKRRGHADDDPSKPETDFATGFLTTTHKWTQRYGYFECRMKLPRAAGLWPAFWMMPDRGESAGAAREDTRNGGMEFDILEYLSRYGPYRYNVACHWDGYDKDHKSNGSDRLYVRPDKEGFYTAGLLWEPGRAAFYCNGKRIAVWEDPRVASVPEYILFTAVSGGWGGNELTGEGLPGDLVIDYVRAWQRSDLTRASVR